MIRGLRETGIMFYLQVIRGSQGKSIGAKEAARADKCFHGGISHSGTHSTIENTYRFCQEGEETPQRLLVECDPIMNRRARSLGGYQTDVEVSPFICCTSSCWRGFYRRSQWFSPPNTTTTTNTN